MLRTALLRASRIVPTSQKIQMKKAVGSMMRPMSTVSPANDYVQKVMNKIFEFSLDDKHQDDYWPLVNAKQLAVEYKHDSRYNTTHEMINDLVTAESAKTFGTGFITGVGGIVALPLGLPAALMSSWILQARLSGTIGEIHGFDSMEPINRTRVLLSMIDADTAAASLEHLNKENNENSLVTYNNVDHKLGEKALYEIGLSRLPVNALAILQAAMVKELVKKTGARAGGRMIPFVGGVIGGAMDTYSLNRVADNSIRIFEAAKNSAK